MMVMCVCVCVRSRACACEMRLSLCAFWEFAPQRRSPKTNCKQCGVFTGVLTQQPPTPFSPHSPRHARNLWHTSRTGNGHKFGARAPCAAAPQQQQQHRLHKHPIRRPVTARRGGGDAGRGGGRSWEGGWRRWVGVAFGGWDKNERYRKGDAAAPSPSYLTPPSPRIKTHR